jgi:hypothetical protein
VDLLIKLVRAAQKPLPALTANQMLLVSLKTFISSPKSITHPVPSANFLYLNNKTAASRRLIAMCAQLGKETPFYGIPKDILNYIFELGRFQLYSFPFIRILVRLVNPDLNYKISNFSYGGGICRKI